MFLCVQSVVDFTDDMQTQSIQALKFCVVILVYVRTEHLDRLVKSLNQWLPETPIFVFVDLCEKRDDLKLQQLVLIEKLHDLKKSLNICDFKVAEKHLNAKKAWRHAMEFAFTKAEKVLYIEDDLLVSRDPKPFIEMFDEFSTTHSILTLYPKKSRHDAKLLTTNWPALWGVYLRKGDYIELYQDHGDKIKIDKLVLDDCYERLNYRRAGERQRFIDLWTYKFSKATKSFTAWDTELHYLLWEKKFEIFVTSDQCLIEQKRHASSITKNKKKRKTRKHWRIKRIDLKWGNHSPNVCIICEKLSYHTYLPRIVKPFVVYHFFRQSIKSAHETLSHKK